MEIYIGACFYRAEHWVSRLRLWDRCFQKDWWYRNIISTTLEAANTFSSSSEPLSHSILHAWIFILLPRRSGLLSPSRGGLISPHYLACITIFALISDKDTSHSSQIPVKWIWKMLVMRLFGQGWAIRSFSGGEYRSIFPTCLISINLI